MLGQARTLLEAIPLRHWASFWCVCQDFECSWGQEKKSSPGRGSSQAGESHQLIELLHHVRNQHMAHNTCSALRKTPQLTILDLSLKTKARCFAQQLTCWGSVNISSLPQRLKLTFSFPDIFSFRKSFGCDINFHLVFECCSFEQWLPESPDVGNSVLPLTV